MSVKIRGMRMPDNCYWCRFYYEPFCYAVPIKRYQVREIAEKNVPLWCPLEGDEEPKGKEVVKE